MHDMLRLWGPSQYSVLELMYNVVEAFAEGYRFSVSLTRLGAAAQPRSASPSTHSTDRHFY